MFSACVRQENDHLGAMGDIWTDVTDVCRIAASELDNVQSMLHVDHFTLKETISAVELMDKKMDQCVGLQGSIQTKDILTPDVPAGGFDMASVLNILQILVVYEAGFLDGASVLESTHNCIYLWEGSWGKLRDHGGLPQQVLLVYCRSLHQSLRLYTKLMLDIDIFEDEDCQPLLSPTLADAILDEDLSTELNICIAEVEKSDCIAQGIKQEILALLHCRMAFNELISTIENCTLALLKYAVGRRKRGILPSAEDCQLLDTLWRRADGKIATAKVSYDSLEAMKMTMNEDVDKVELPPQEIDGRDDDNNVVADRRISAGAQTAFSSIVCKLAQNGPIRHVPLKPYAESIESILKSIKQVKHVRSIQMDVLERSAGTMSSCFKWNSEATSPSDNQGRDEEGVDFDFIFTVALDCAERHFHLLPRCILCGYLNYLSSLGMDTHLLPNSMREKGVPSTLRTGALVQTEWIPNSLSLLYWEVLKMLCTHRHKMVAKSEAILNSFAEIVLEARYLDEQFAVAAEMRDNRQTWCSHWICTTLVQIMSLHWRLLSDCELLSASELDYYYAYGDFLLGYRMWVEKQLGELRYGLMMLDYEDAIRGGAKDIPCPPTPDPYRSPAYLTMFGEREM